MKKTKTSGFGVGKRESHDASEFYNRSLYAGISVEPATPQEMAKVTIPAPGEWADQIYNHSSTRMSQIPDNSVALAFTSPPYNVGKNYEGDLSMQEYFDLISQVGSEVYRVLRPGGRYVINIANLGRKPYIPLHAYFYQIHLGLNFLPMGEIIWQKAAGASGNCAWGSWMSAKSPRLRDLHEYLLVFAKQAYSRPDRGESDIERDEFMSATLSVWEIPAESARRVGHPAPFPVALAERVLQLYSYVGDVVLDPFMGSGTTCVAAAQQGRRYVGYEISQEYCSLAAQRIAGDDG
jgi:modification methylase